MVWYLVTYRDNFTFGISDLNFRAKGLISLVWGNEEFLLTSW